ncbi:glycine cleavage system aminomethyltransferase GcvT [Streptomyces umbrinus]|uniref:glycine cleavage system aminomethyltransferase GcvT n=1 Tax=Streptomyces umbrinus TaxID=67370 RepID=UPI0033E9EC39
MSKKAPLYEIHRALDASFTDYAGWSMPLRYTSELAEHQAVRNAAGIFDLSHMGEIDICGPEAARALDYALIGQPSKIAVGRARYTMLVHETGGVLDDLVVYRLREERYLIVANAGNTPIVLSTLRDRIDGYNTTIEDVSAHCALIAVQGPKAPAVIRELADPEVLSLRYYAITLARLAGQKVLIARTGYTGEDGFEIYCRPQQAPTLWQAASEAGIPHGLLAAGLACRDTLRLEAGMPLYGQELTIRTTPFDAGLGKLVVFGKPGGFVGQAALAASRDAEPIRHLVGLASIGRRAPRAGYLVLDPDTGERIGEVTSGALSPTLGHPVAMAYLKPGRTAPGTKVLLDIRGQQQPAEVTTMPFYRRPLTTPEMRRSHEPAQ